MNTTHNEECTHKANLDIVDPHILSNTFNYTIQRFKELTKSKASSQEK